MAAQQQQQQLTRAQLAVLYPPNPGYPNISKHFWDSSQTSYSSISKIYDRGATYTQEDVVWHAWHDILTVYFPQETTPTNPIRWQILREAYRGLPPTQNPSQTKPDVITVRLNTLVIPGQRPQTQERDFLWVECKAASHDTPHGWKNLIEESIVRLNHAHQVRPLCLVVAVGWKCMFFFWDPNGQAQLQPWIESADKRSRWNIDRRLQPWRATPWANTTTGQIIPAHAMELDCWTLAPPQAGQNVLHNGNNLGLVEHFLVTVQTMPLHLHGQNPTTF